jgi:hypothetical protein
MSTVYSRFKNATRDELMQHAEQLDLQMKILAALLDGRSGATDVSKRNIEQAAALAEAIPQSARAVGSKMDQHQ